MRHICKVITHLALLLCIICCAFTPGNCAEIDDSSVFIEAFNAFQQKDYLLAIEKCDVLNQVFPDSPLRDASLLLIARASLKSGDNERAAKLITQFLSEFPESSLKASIEDELNTLAGRYRNKEALQADKTLQAAARKIRSDRIAREQAAAIKLENERAAKAKAEQERIASIKREEERREKERLLAEKLAKANIKVDIALRDNANSTPVGSTGSLPIEISNKGKEREEFLLSVSTAKEFDAILTIDGKPDENIEKIQLAAGESFRGSVKFRMPTELVDGHRSPLTVKAVSSKYSDVSFNRDAVLVSSAPLVRAVAKLTKQKVIPGEKTRYKITVLNIGSMMAQNLTVRLQLPSQIDFQDVSDTSYKHEINGTLVFKIDRVDVGNLAEINLDVKIRENSSVGQELRGVVEVVNGTLQRKDIFTGTVSTVVAAK